MLETVFLAAQGVAFVGWIPLFALPWVGRERAVAIARAAAAALCLLYLAYFIRYAAQIPRDGYTLDAIGRAFDVPQLLLAGWIHYLAFDLWVGSWQAEHSERTRLPHWALLPCLFATMMIGPFGLLLYLGAARLAGRRDRG